MEHCYLCGQEIADDRSDDHVPAKQFFAKSIRKVHNLSGLITLVAHRSCNKAFELDEDYFAASLVPLAIESPSGLALAQAKAARLAEGRSRGLILKTLREFEEKPSGLSLPGNLIIKRVEGKRLVRVAWKIVRGLFKIESKRILPESTPFMIEVFEPEIAAKSTENQVWEVVKAQPGKGAYPGVFDYKYMFGREGDLALHAWGMLFWDQIMIFVAHHDPADADCDDMGEGASLGCRFEPVLAAQSLTHKR